jgi:hypothetical protein
MFSRDLTTLDYDNLRDPRLGGGSVGINNSSTFILPDPEKQFYWELFWVPLWTGAAKKLREVDELSPEVERLRHREITMVVIPMASRVNELGSGVEAAPVIKNAAAS